MVHSASNLFCSDDAFTTPAPDGKAPVFKFNSNIYLDLDEDPDARRQCLKLQQKIHDEGPELVARKPTDKQTPSRLQIAQVVSHANGEDGTEQSTLQKNYPVSFTYYSLLDDLGRHSSSNGSRDAPMPGVPPRSASDVKLQSRFDGSAMDPGAAAAAVVCDALVKKNVASAKDLQPLMPVFQTILHPNYLSALGSGHVQIPVIPQIRAVVATCPSSPDSVMMGSQILNMRCNAQEIQAHLKAVHWSNKREWHDNDSTSGSVNEGPSRNSSC